MSFKVGGFGFSLHHSKPVSLVLKRGESILIEVWRWRKFGYVQKLISMSKDGEVSVKQL